MRHEYKKKCSQPNNSNELNRYGYDLYKAYKKTCGEDEKFDMYNNNHCRILKGTNDEEVVDAMKQRYRQCALGRESFAKECIIRSVVDPNHDAAVARMYKYEGECGEIANTIRMEKKRRAELRASAVKTGICSDIGNVTDCRTANNCHWKASSKKCMTRDTYCAEKTNVDTCGDAPSCMWDSKKCIPRRFEEAEQ